MKPLVISFAKTYSTGLGEEESVVSETRATCTSEHASLASLYGLLHRCISICKLSLLCRVKVPDFAEAIPKVTVPAKNCKVAFRHPSQVELLFISTAAFQVD